MDEPKYKMCGQCNGHGIYDAMDGPVDCGECGWSGSVEVDEVPCASCGAAVDTDETFTVDATIDADGDGTMQVCLSCLQTKPLVSMTDAARRGEGGEDATARGGEPHG